MALPWTAPGFGQGIYPGDAPFYVPRPVDPSIIAEIARQRAQQQQQISGGIQNAIESVGKYMEQKQRDDIANQLMAQANAPRAGVVSWPSLETTGATDQLTSPEMAQNKALGYGTKPTTPDLGGLFGFQLRQQQTKNYYDQLKDQAQVQHLNYLTGGGSGSTGGGTGGRPYYDYTDPNSGQTMRVTGNRLSQLTQTPTQRQPAAKPDPWANLLPVGRGRLDTSTGKFVGDPNGDMIKLATPTGYSVTASWAEYNRRRGLAAQPGVNEAAAALNNEAPLPAPDVPAAPNYSQSIPAAPQARTAPQAAIDYLRAHPETADAFLAKYGYTP